MRGVNRPMAEREAQAKQSETDARKTGEKQALHAPGAEPTPVMAQYLEIKAANADCLLFYRMGDFYELFFEDAEQASRTLGIALTKRGKHLGEDIPMCGVPVRAADQYLQKLIRAEYRVAVCEQMEDPAIHRFSIPCSTATAGRRDRQLKPGDL